VPDLGQVADSFIERKAARVIVIDPEGAVLLQQIEGDAGVSSWITPGGGLSPGESYEEAARRTRGGGWPAWSRTGAVGVASHFSVRFSRRSLPAAREVLRGARITVHFRPQRIRGHRSRRGPWSSMVVGWWDRVCSWRGVLAAPARRVASAPCRREHADRSGWRGRV